MEVVADKEVGGRGSLKIRRGEGGLVDFSDCCVSFDEGMSNDNVAGRVDDGFETPDSLVAVVALDAISPRHRRSTLDVNYVIILVALAVSR